METNNNEVFMNPYTDFGFKKLFGTEPNKDLLISFLNALFDGDQKTIVDLKYLNTEVLGPYYGDRNSVFDVYCITEDDARDWNYKLTDVCVVGILDFVFPNKEYADDSYVHKVTLKDNDDNHEVYHKLAFYYVEMPKFKKKENELETMQDKWLYVLKNICYLLSQPKELQDKVFTKFFEEARIGMFTKEERFAYMISQKHYWDNHNTIAYSYEKGEKAGKQAGLKEGKELGLAEGEAKVRKELAQKLLSKGMSPDDVLEITGCSLDPTLGRNESKSASPSPKRPRP